MKRVYPEVFTQYLRDHYNHLRYNTYTKTAEYPDGRALVMADYMDIKHDIEKNLDGFVSYRLIRRWLSSTHFLTSFTPPPPVSQHFVAGRPEYALWCEKPCALLYRRKGSDKTDPCPFCGKKHAHGTAPGHRCSHCPSPNKKTLDEVSATDGTVLRRETGYIIKEY